MVALKMLVMKIVWMVMKAESLLMMVRMRKMM